ncbi:MAG: sensor histidine kinase, partial [Lachnospiraceae bacterium]|nr:sensor histidine kinase [Lachnospiraceae bacterium]
GIMPVLEITEKRVVRMLYPSYVERIITNLLSNAIKYSDGDLEISLSEDGKLRVANSAKELSNVDVNKLFDRFFTVENARNNSTGLGLSIVKLFAARMDCGLGAKYENGKLVIEIQF